ncbi:hypothetical protein LguiA_015964 [Lonicera macranthoides]
MALVFNRRQEGKKAPCHRRIQNHHLFSLSKKFMQLIINQSVSNVIELGIQVGFKKNQRDNNEKLKREN